MKKVLVSLLVSALLLAALPVAPVAADDAAATNLDATLSIDYILPGNVTPVGQYPDGNYHWKVSERPTGGTISGNVFNGYYQLLYSGTLKPDQSGKVHGDLNIMTATGTATANITAQVGSTSPVGIIFSADGVHTVLMATLSDAHFAIASGTGEYADLGGTGEFAGAAYLVLDTANEHVIGLLNGSDFVVSLAGLPLGFLKSEIAMTGRLTGI